MLWDEKREIGHDGLGIVVNVNLDMAYIGALRDAISGSKL